MKKQKTIEHRIVEAIIYDLSDRRGLKGEWNMIDADIKRQIREAWRRIVREQLESQLDAESQ